MLASPGELSCDTSRKGGRARSCICEVYGELFKLDFTI